MKATVERGALVKALGRAASVVEKKSTIPILANVLLEAEGEELRLTATDLELQVSLPLPASVTAPGSTTVPAALLQSIARELADGCQVELELAEGRLKLAAGRARYKLPALDADQFPRVAAIEEAVSFTWSAAPLRVMLTKVAHAQGDDPSRFYLMGVHLEHHAGALVAAATNGHLLASASCEAPENSTEIPSIIIPLKAVSEISAMLADADDAELGLAVTPKQIRLTLGEVTLTSKLIDGQFPEWRRVVPASNPHTLKVDCKQLAGGVRRAMVISAEKARSVNLELSADKVTVSATSFENGEGLEEVPAAWEGPELKLGINARYLLDTIAAMGSETLEARLSDPRSPTLFTNPGDASAQWVVMPMTAK